MRPNLDNIMMCATCRVVLDEREPIGPDGPVSTGVHWRHSYQDKDADHEAVPVPADWEIVRSRCDFCNDECPAIELATLPVADYYIGHLNGDDHWNRGDFACCEECVEYLAVDPMDWESVLGRLCWKWVGNHGPDSLTQGLVLGFITHLTQVRDAVKGPPYLESEL